MSVLRDDPSAMRFEMDEAGHTVFADYRREAGRLIIDHVEAPPALRGTGALDEAIAAYRQSLAGEEMLGFMETTAAGSFAIQSLLDTALKNLEAAIGGAGTEGATPEPVSPGVSS